jgi:hypothetical protein
VVLFTGLKIFQHLNEAQALVFLAAVYTRMGTAAIYEVWTHLEIKYAFSHTRSDTTEASFSWENFGEKLL